jgi:phosphatidylserine/phosphatidylglycerophosphate/cardiolipin synthase-like enzyme
MKYWQYIIISLLISTTSWANVAAYFNQNKSSNYTDPYRGISRAGDNLEEVLLKEIRSAKKTIYIAVQELRLPLLAQALIQKKKEGIDVRIVLEHDYNFDVLTQRESSEGEHEASRLSDLRAFVDYNRNGKIEQKELETRDAIYMLHKARVPIIDDTFDGSFGSGLMHHKFMIVDGKSTVVSTANFTMSCIHGDLVSPSSRGNANSLILVNSVNFAKIFTEEFSQLWGNGRRGNFGQGKTYRGSVSTVVRGTKITVQFSPTSRRYHWEESVNGLIASHLSKANHSIKAALFVFSDQKIADVMERRQEKGAEIGVIIEPSFGYRDYSELLDLMGLQMLNGKCGVEAGNNPWKKPIKEAGIARLPIGDKMHHKFAVVDKKTVIVGSQNWSDAANFINDETLIIIEDQRISEQFTREYDRIKSTALLGPSSNLLQQIRKQEQTCKDHGYYY